MASATVDPSDSDSMSAVHPDIIRTQILTRLDGPTLASAACTSSQLQTLCTEEKLWRDICTATWPSSNDPLVRHVISTFPSGHRSFFADSYPIVECKSPAAKYEPSMAIAGLVSAVDLYYKGDLIFSKVQETTTVSGWFMCSPFRVELLDPKESISTRIQNPGWDYDMWGNHLVENLTLNWLLIDPSGKRAANVSSRRPVSAKRDWLTGEVQIRYATVVVRPPPEMEAELVVVVTCAADEEDMVGGKVHVSEVSLQMEDMEGKGLSGRDSLEILKGIMEGGRGKRGGEKYEEFAERKLRWKVRKEKIEKTKDMACTVVGVTLFLAFWCFIVFR